MNKATENLTAAQLCCDQGLFNACANRLYYAMFHAAIAALLKNGAKLPPKNIGHDWVQSNFSGLLIHRRKVFSAKFRPYLSDAYSVRSIADYQILVVSKDLAFRELKRAKEFVNAINVEVNNETQS
jgi:uncharacterized protein (UPF0332 family)